MDGGQTTDSDKLFQSFSNSQENIVLYSLALISADSPTSFSLSEYSMC